MLTTYNVRVRKTKVYRGSRVTTYYVRWTVDGRESKKPFRTSAQAESFRSDLVVAARKGEAFYTSTGLPVSMQRAEASLSWYTFACGYVDMKWPRAAATTRRTIAEALTAITCQMFTDERGMPDGIQLRAALKRWAFNTGQRDSTTRPDWVDASLSWANSHTRPVATLSDPTVLRRVLDGIAVRLDGQPRAPSVVARWRKILNNAVEYAVERKVLAVNPIPTLKWKPPRTANVVDRRRVANPAQARALLDAVRDQGTTGQRLVAFFGCLYFAALRPEEAAALTIHSLDLPTKGWGEIHLERARPHAGGEWTDTGRDRDDRPLKQRGLGEIRVVPSPPELTAMLHQHIATFGTTKDGRLFVGERSGDHLPSFTVFRVWTRARTRALTASHAASPLAARPYDLRHAAVSTWLNAGVPAPQVAEWAGHSVEVLLSIYAKCVDGDAAEHRAKIAAALDEPTQPKVGRVFARNTRRLPPTAGHSRTQQDRLPPAL